MKAASQFEMMNRWFDDSPGRFILEAEQLALDKVLSSIYGYHLVQIGGIPKYRYNSCIIRDRVLVISQTKAECSFDGSVVRSSLHELPFQEESVDLMVVPHVLEFIKTPLKMLNEINNILIPGGKVIIFAFNPTSFFGITKMFKLKNKHFPWQGKFHSASRIKNWLQNIGLNPIDHKSFCFVPPFQNVKWFNKFKFFETFGQLVWPFWGDAYMLIAKKEAIPVTPLRVKVYKKKIPVSSGYPEPSAFPKVNLYEKS